MPSHFPRIEGMIIRKLFLERNAIMKKVNVYVIGGVGHGELGNYYKLLLEYKEVTKFIEGKIKEETTPNRCIITGIIKAVEILKEPVNLTIHITTPIGIKAAKKGKGVNYDLVNRLLILLNKKGCNTNFEYWHSNAEQLRNLIKDKK
ncbi:hypothetical protein MWH25_10360 [Natroniella acetigena]|uniref:hypothetical protein n=1 Tax=Natroniella acetigena TaxID=52004 RepID=UPI00200A692A|nr:hypothetical protein [Natroniella acetigena]MCK8828133.1 hypothetical protein [Natroniella acetigena]